MIRSEFAATSSLCLLVLSTLVAAETIQTRLGELTLDHTQPTPESRQKLYDELDFQRAVQGVVWAEPAINNALFQRGMETSSTSGHCARIAATRHSSAGARK